MLDAVAGGTRRGRRQHALRPRGACTRRASSFFQLSPPSPCLSPASPPPTHTHNHHLASVCSTTTTTDPLYVILTSAWQRGNVMDLFPPHGAVLCRTPTLWKSLQQYPTSPRATTQSSTLCGRGLPPPWPHPAPSSPTPRPLTSRWLLTGSTATGERALFPPPPNTHTRPARPPLSIVCPQCFDCDRCLCVHHCTTHTVAGTCVAALPRTIYVGTSCIQRPHLGLCTSPRSTPRTSTGGLAQRVFIARCLRRGRARLPGYPPFGSTGALRVCVGVVWCRGHNGVDVGACAMDPRGRFVATGEIGGRPRVHVWDAVTGTPVAKLAYLHRKGT